MASAAMPSPSSLIPASMSRKPRSAKKAPPRRRERKESPLAVLPWLALAGMALMWPTRAGKGSEAPSASALARLEPGRGRSAHWPLQIPWRGWRDILGRTWVSFNEDQIMTRAGAVTFFGLLALFPAVTVFVSLYGVFADVHDAEKQVVALASIAPRPAVIFLGEQMLRVSKDHPPQLTPAFALGVVLAIWSANSGMMALINALNAAYGEVEKRTWLRLTVHGLVFTVGAMAFTLFTIGAIVAFPLLLPGVRRAAAWFDVLRWPALVLVGGIALSIVYRYGPSRQHARWRWVSTGSALASLLWVAASVLFSWYVQTLGHYDRIYGPFAAAAGAMMWLWISTVILLFGAELNAQIEHQTAVDSTTGPPQPPGLRGAAVADGVGAATG